jgi:hypothetical protein
MNKDEAHAEKEHR